jgi:hypothetical protein
VPVRLTCGLCGAITVNGIVARTTWGELELNPHGTAHACPMCLERYPNDWQSMLREAAAGTMERSAAAGRGDPYGRNWSLES